MRSHSRSIELGRALNKLVDRGDRIAMQEFQEAKATSMTGALGN